MSTGLLYVTCPQSGPDPDSVARKYFNDDVPGAEAHYRYLDKEKLEILSLYIVTNPKSLADYVNANPQFPQGVSDIRVYEQYRAWGNMDEKPVPNQLTLTVGLTPPDAADCDKWYEDEHVDMLSEAPGWIGSARYRTLAGKCPNSFALHHYANGPDFILGEDPKFKAASATDWSLRILKECVSKPGCFELNNWIYQSTLPICPNVVPDKLRQFVINFYKTSDTPGAHEQYANLFANNGWTAYYGKTVSGKQNICKFRQDMWTTIVQRHHRVDRIYISSKDELAIYGSSSRTDSEGNKLANIFWARMKFQDVAADEPKLLLYESNKREPLTKVSTG